jgi:hypothetical protein
MTRSDPGSPGQERGVAGEAASDEVAALQRRLDAALGRVAQLEEALQSRVVIEQAKGKLGERFQLTPAQAFELLRGSARSARMSIHALAEDVVASRTTPDVIVREIRSLSERDPARTS